MEFSDLFDTVRAVLPASQEVYLVGGAVRDYLSGKPMHDLDFVMAGDTKKAAHSVARALKSPFFILDDHRLTARVIYKHEAGEEYWLDFASLVENDLLIDLRQRDFTINAIAMDVKRPKVLIDPCGGESDLNLRILRTCSPVAMINDPLRVLRGVRLAVAMDLAILSETEDYIRQSLPGLAVVSGERKRDELMRILDGVHPDKAVRLLSQLGISNSILPEIEELKGVKQTTPHVLELWEHTLSTLKYLEELLKALNSPNEVPGAGLPIDSAYNEAALSFTNFRQLICSHISESFVQGRSSRSLLFLAALYHDVAKPFTLTIDENGQVHNYGHEIKGAEIIERRARELVLSKIEIDYLRKCVANHMRVHSLAMVGPSPTRRAIYRYFRDTGEAGVDICLLSLADTLATYGPEPDKGRWMAELAVCQDLFEAWWKKPGESIRPHLLLNGNDLMTELNLKPGPRLGRLLVKLHEAQASGEVTTREEALDFSKKGRSTNADPMEDDIGES